MLRLNQLGFFEPIKEEDATLKPDDRTGLLDIDLRVKEKGRNTISFTGGAGGSSGSFVGLSYSTNNLLGYGESLSFDLATGTRQQAFAVSFAEPYLLDRNVSLGVSLFAQSLDFFNGGFGFTGPTGFFGNASDNDLLFEQKQAGFSVFSTTPLTTLTKRWPTFGRWTRVGLSYSYSTTTVEDPPVNRDNIPGNDLPVPFRQPGLRTSTVAPSLFYNTLNHPLDPTQGQSLSISLGLSGKFLGGDVNLLQPAVEYKRFQTVPLTVRDEPTVLGFRLRLGHLAPYGERVESNSLSFVGGTPIYSRFFLGGDDSIRGYPVRSVSPLVALEQRLTTNQVRAVSDTLIGSLSTDAVLPMLKESDPPLTTPFIREEVVQAFTFPDQFPRPSLIPIGGDTSLLFNVEYRIPIAGPLSVAAFGDIGSAFNLRRYDDQVIISNPRRQTINPLFFPPKGARGVVFGPGGGIVINPDGRLASLEEIEFARLAQGLTSDVLPNGFTNIFMVGLNQTTSTIFLSEADSGFSGLKTYRASLGVEFRIQVPVVNLPLRLIYAYNPNAKVKPAFPGMLPEDRSVFRLGIGRTF